MNEFDLLSAAINTAIKHGNHNQKLHGRRFGPDAGGGAGGGLSSADILSADIKNVSGSNEMDYFIADKKYRTLRAEIDAVRKEYFTEAEKGAVKTYQGVGYLKINGVLSGRKTDPAIVQDVNEIVKQIDSAMSKSVIPLDTVVYRGVSVSDERLAEMTKIGSVIRRGGYTSTSTSIDETENFAESDNGNRVIMHIKVPAGSNGLHVDSITNKPRDTSEMEVLLPRNSSFIIRGSRKQEVDGDFYFHIDVELLPGDAE